MWGCGGADYELVPSKGGRKVEPPKVIKLHVRETPLGFAMVVRDSLKQLVAGAGYQVNDEIEDILEGSGFIEIYTLVSHELVARIDFELMHAAGQLSVELRSYSVEMNAVFDDLLSELRDTLHKFEIVGP